MRWYLLKVFGKRAFWGYGVVALLSVSILAALYLASGYGLHAYVSDQLSRIPWDISLVHRGEAHRFRELQREYAAIPEVRSMEMVGFLRMRNGAPLELEINGEQTTLRWITFIAASKPELLPPELRQSRTGLADGTVKNSSAVSTVVGLVGTQQGVREGHVVRLSYLYGAIPEGMHEHGAGDHGEEQEVEPLPRLLFEDQLMRTPAPIERQEFNKWMLREVGSLSYLPDDAIIFSVPLEVFEELAQLFHRLFFTSEGIHGGEAASPYLPEMTHLISIERGEVVSPWDLGGSLRRLSPIVRGVYQAGRWLTPFSYVNSDLFLLLGRMNAVARLVSLATLLIAIPFLWMSWVLARTLGRLLILNERRLMGLALIRGIAIQDIGRALLQALLLGGTAGGLLGLIAGTGLTLLGYRLAGYSTPPPSVLVRGVVYFALFLGLGVLLAVLSGREVLRYVRRLTPRETVARVEAVEESSVRPRFSWGFVLSCLGALGIGGYKIVSWILGYSLLPWVFASLLPGAVNVLLLMESLLNFIAIPLFLFGLSGLVMWKMGWVQKGLNVLTAPLVGALGWFVSRHMALGRHRIANLLFVAALAMSLSLLPQVAADGFYGRVLRGMRASIGGDVLLEFDMANLTGGEVDIRPISEHQQRLQPHISSIRSLIAAQEEVASVVTIEQFFIPGIYIPGQSGLAFNVIEDPEKYLQLVYYEDGLGITRNFSDIIGSLREGNVPASQGLFRIRSIPLDREVILGYGMEGRPVHARLSEVIAFLPGQPALGIENREGFVTAEMNYLNHLLRSDARIIASAEYVRGPDLRELEVIPSRVVFVVESREGVSKEELARKITTILPIGPEQVRWEALERERVSKDMFISLALENMKVYMVGGLVLALASVAAIALVNFAADRRTFALLRLRGIPLPILLRIALSIFLIPAVGGVIIGGVLGAISGYGMSQAVWDLPRIYGVAGFLSNQLILSSSAWAIVVGLSFLFAAIALGFGLWLFRRTAREAIRER